MASLINLLSVSTGLNPHDVKAIIMRAPVSYKRYTIPKRSGGFRIIAQPAREVKRLQRSLVELLSGLPVHAAAAAYVRSLSIADNAARHSGNGPILKFDFKDFFTSLRERDWQEYCARKAVFDDISDVMLSSRLLFHRVPDHRMLRLAIGAPSSPWLSNVLMYEFDEIITGLVGRDKVTYSRYADDLTFSAQRTGYLNGVEKALRHTIAGLHAPRLTLNDDKTVLATMKYRRVVTGLVLANDGRVTLGRDRKRRIRAALHQASLGKLDREALVQLGGMIAFVKSAEPAFFEQIAARYGGDIIARLSATPEAD